MRYFAKYLRISILTLLLLFVGTTLSFSAENRPWYSASLESLGFYVFDQPFEQPNFAIASVSGSMKSRLSSKGNITLLNFWATWCPPCKEEIPTIQKLHEIMNGEKFEIMAIDLGEPSSTVKSFVNQNKLSFPVYLDPKNSLASLYASRGIPTTYILDKKGAFIAAIIGSFDYSNPQFVSIIKELSRR